MLKADIALPDLARDIALRDDRILFGSSSIAPYLHPALETRLVRTEGQWFATVRERTAADSSGPGIFEEIVDAENYERLYRASLVWPLDYVLIEAACDGCRLKIRAGAYGTVPLYARCENDRVRLSWDFTDFLFRSLVIDMEIASHMLALHTVYSSRQVCAGVTMLTERASLYIEPGRAHYQYPPAVMASAIADLQQVDDPAGMFGSLLQQSVSIRPVEQAWVQLSGGMDSAAVASAVAAMHGPAASGGILLAGDCRAPQQERRERIVRRLGLADETVEMSDFPPSLDLRPASRRRESPYKEYYLEAFDALWSRARAGHARCLFTGIGGDELFLPFRHEHLAQDDARDRQQAELALRAEKLLTARALGMARTLRTYDAPPSPVPTSALLAQACQAPRLLEHGLWPVNPLSDPALVRACHRMAAVQRHEREPVRQYLATSLGAEVFPRGYAKETFGQVLPPLIAQHAESIAGQLRECALADLGLIDRDAALALLEEVRVTRSQLATAPLASLLWLERFVRQVA